MTEKGVQLVHSVFFSASLCRYVRPFAPPYLLVLVCAAICAHLPLPIHSHSEVPEKDITLQPPFIHEILL